MRMAKSQAEEDAVQLLPASLVGSGTLAGAVKTIVVLVLPLAGMLPVWSLQLVLVPGVDLPVESNEVVRYWQVHLLMLVSVLPVTVAVRVSDCETMSVVDGLTVTVITLVLLPPPHPESTTSASAIRLARIT